MDKCKVGIREVICREFSANDTHWTDFLIKSLRSEEKSVDSESDLSDVKSWIHVAEIMVDGDPSDLKHIKCFMLTTEGVDVYFGHVWYMIPYDLEEDRDICVIFPSVISKSVPEKSRAGLLSDITFACIESRIESDKTNLFVFIQDSIPLDVDIYLKSEGFKISKTELLDMHDCIVYSKR